MLYLTDDSEELLLDSISFRMELCIIDGLTKHPPHSIVLARSIRMKANRTIKFSTPNANFSTRVSSRCALALASPRSSYFFLSKCFLDDVFVEGESKRKMRRGGSIKLLPSPT